MNDIAAAKSCPDRLDFAADVTASVDRHFRTHRLSRKANAAMVVKTVVLLALYVGSYALVLSGLLSLPGMWALCLVMGIAMAGIGFSIAHDALHGAYSEHRRVNDWLGGVFVALGANPYMWKLTHNTIHHTYPNVQGYDEDLEVSPLVRLSPLTTYRQIHRFQHISAFLVYSFATLFWVFVKDYKYFLAADLGPYRSRRHDRSAWAGLLVGKAGYYCMAIILPWLVLDLAWWQFALGFLTVHLTAGLILGVVFQLAHVVESTAHVAPREMVALKRSSWMVHQMRTTNNFARSNRILSWYIGGLNFQIEHHLFPRICHVHYSKLSTIVEEVAARHGVPYHCHPSFLAALASHIRMLRAYGQPDRPGMAEPA